MFTSFSLEEAQSKSFFAKEPLQVYKKRKRAQKMVILHKLGLEDYEIRYLIAIKTKKQASLKWNNDFDI